ncbi:Hypothetical predicted protein [Octopus vulgaris]|uniref:Uncharacterized protein n=1 Tax=Octopus vulgaris TaxID=6645 RepID=A0AA36EZ80_OCTVU|nr:Hypothetical predicted protein [Octopus vulgaris]
MKCSYTLVDFYQQFSSFTAFSFVLCGFADLLEHETKCLALFSHSPSHSESSPVEINFAFCLSGGSNSNFTIHCANDSLLLVGKYQHGSAKFAEIRNKTISSC